MTNYEPDTQRDRTGEAYAMSAKAPQDQSIKRDLTMFKQPVKLQCPHCNEAERFRAFVDSVGDSNLAMIGCSKCGYWTRAFQMHVPQMTNERAKALGIWTPGNDLVAVDFEIEVE